MIDSGGMQEEIREWPKVEGKYLIDTGPSGRGASWWENLGRCPQRWAFDADVRRRNAQAPARGHTSAPALIKGTLVHIGMAHFYEAVRRQQTGELSSGAIHDPVEAVWAKVRLEAGDDTTNPWHKHGEVAARAVGRYVDAVCGTQQPTIVAVEKRFELVIPLLVEHVGVEYARYSTRVDLIAADAADRVTFIDHKTTSGRVDATKKQGFTLSLQFLGLVRVGRHFYGDKFAGTMINLVALTDLSGVPVRVRPELAPWAIAQFDSVLLDRAFLLKGLIDQDRPLYHWPKALTEQGPCTDRYGVCSHSMKCRFGPDSVSSSDGEG